MLPDRLWHHVSESYCQHVILFAHYLWKTSLILDGYTLDFYEQNSLLEKLQPCEAASFPNTLQTLYIEDKAAGK